MDSMKTIRWDAQKSLRHTVLVFIKMNFTPAHNLSIQKALDRDLAYGLDSPSRFPTTELLLLMFKITVDIQMSFMGTSGHAISDL
jgi:hypothetical protein